MAPELRKRKPVEAVKPAAAAPKAAAKAAPKTKRKAAEEASPVSSKKQKATKKTAVERKSTPKKATKSKKVEEEKQDESMVDEKEEKEEAEKEKEEEKQEEQKQQQEEEQEEEADDQQLQVLAVDLDPEDEEAPNEADAYKDGQAVGTIPKVAKEVQQAAHAKAQAHEGSGVIYLGRIPHGFYEKQMNQYLSQFGPILRLRLSRNRKTGASKHFAFVEFAEASTAEIVAKTMDNYLLFGHILKCKQVDKAQLHEDVWKGANRTFKKVPWNKLAGKQLERPLSESAWAQKLAKEKSSRAKKAAKLKEMGYEFEAPELKDVPAPAAIENENGDKEEEVKVKAIEAAPEEEEKVEETAVEAEEPAAAVEAEPEVVAEEPKAKKATKASTKASAKAKEAKATKVTKATRSKKAKA